MQTATMPQRYSDFDVSMTWTVQTIDRKTVFDGAIQNIRYAVMEEIEIWVAILDTNGKTVSRAVDLVMPRRLELDGTTAFRVTIPIVVPHGARIVFTYKYSGDDGGEGTKWMNSFESCAP